jgi:hypothetical protein
MMYAVDCCLDRCPVFRVRGLPCYFANIVDTFGERTAFIAHNFFAVKTVDCM